MPDESYTQDHRLIAVDTPLGKDVLLLAGVNRDTREFRVCSATNWICWHLKTTP